jgi:hypothetical protein
MEPTLNVNVAPIAAISGAEDRVTPYGWKALAGSVLGYAMDGFDLSAGARRTRDLRNAARAQQREHVSIIGEG